jgi:hypothetical protein
MAAEISRQPVFENFREYWYFAKNLSDTQRKILFTSLPYEQQSRLERSYECGGWHDVVIRNELDAYIDWVKEEYEYDLLDIRCRVMAGKSVFLPKPFWDKIVNDLDEYSASDTRFIIGGMQHETCRANREVVLIIKEDD